MPFIAVYITYPDKETASAISDFLIQQRIVACANIFPIKSAYWWNDVVASEDEYVSIVKTTLENWDELQTLVEDKHPYDVPCIMKIEVAANKKYEDWISREVTPPHSPSNKLL